MSAPFLDRFGISVPISMPKSQDIAVILESQDEKLGGYDELIQITSILSEEQLLKYLVWCAIIVVLPKNSRELESIHHTHQVFHLGFLILQRDFGILALKLVRKFQTCPKKGADISNVPTSFGFNVPK